MLLAIDIGNTNICFGLFEGDRLRYEWRLNTDARLTADDYRASLRSLAADARLELPGAVDDLVIGSVAPVLTATLARMAAGWLKREPLIVHAGLDWGMALRVKEPRRAGVDRLLNALAARASLGAPCISLDFGTATKFDVVGPDGDFWGGAIAPGLLTAAESLVRNTAQLPAIDFAAPPGPIGDDTASAMQSGIVLGYAGLVEGLLARIQAALPGPLPAPVVATGGLAGVLLPLIRPAIGHDPALTLHGLRLIRARNP